MSIYGKMKNIGSAAGLSTLQQAGRAANFYTSGAGAGAKHPLASALGATLGAVPAATRWAALSQGVGSYEGMGNINFSVGGAVEHNGAAYGISTRSSGLTEKSLHYGQGDLRGTSRTQGLGRQAPTDPLMPGGRGKTVTNSPGGPTSSWTPPEGTGELNFGGPYPTEKGLNFGRKNWNPGGAQQSAPPPAPESKPSESVMRGYDQPAPESLFQRGQGGEPARPLFDNADQVDAPYSAPTGGMGRGPRTTRRQVQANMEQQNAQATAVHEQVLDANLTQNGQQRLFD